MMIILKQGKLKGIEKISVLSKQKYYSFLGIPYAEPPINSLRFQAPKPHKGWSDVYDASKPRSACLQKDTEISPTPFGDEDCLYINIHTPEYPTQTIKPKPVLVFVHGGGFFIGSGNLYSPDYLINQDIVVVTFNYRLHVFGFLNLGLLKCPGNVGLKDQMLAFQWIKENIRAFGGDPSNITAYGESAGAASIHYLMISPLTRNLFNKAILQSGSAFCVWAQTEQNIKYAFQLGNILGCYTTDKEELLEFLLPISADKLLNATLKLMKQSFYNTDEELLIFVPSVEQGPNVDLKLLPEKPKILAKNALPVPCITGINNIEGLFFVPDLQKTNFFDNQNLYQFIPKTWNISSDDALVIKNKIKEFYFNGNTNLKECIPELVNLLTDFYFGRNFYEIFQKTLETTSNIPIFLYNFCYDGHLNVYKRYILSLCDAPEMKGACHGDDLFYLFNLNIESYPVEDLYQTEIKMINTMCTFWANFAKYGFPTLPTDNINWKQTSVDKPCYLNIDDKIEMKEGKINENRINFWNNLERSYKYKGIIAKLKL